MGLHLTGICKNYNHQAVIPVWDHTFDLKARIAIVGGNGSGKSTFLKLLSGQLTPSAGTLTCPDIPPSDWPLYCAYTGPHIDLIEGFTPRELFAQHSALRPLRPEANLDLIYPSTDILDRSIRSFSSGMKQRIKLALAIWTDAPLLLLDEPTSHLDIDGIRWFQALLTHSISPSARFTHRLLFVASNHKQEETFACTEAYLPSGEGVVPLTSH